MRCNGQEVGEEQYTGVVSESSVKKQAKQVSWGSRLK